MGRELSSKASFIHRTLVPIALIAGAALSLWQISKMMDAGGQFRVPVILALAVSAGMIALAWFLSRAKRVWLENDRLIVVGFSETAIYPLKEIHKVAATRFWNPERIRIHVRTPLGEDEAFFFYPPIRWFKLWSPHPIAEEIRQLAHAAVSPTIPYVQVTQPTSSKLIALGAAGFVLLAFAIIGSATTMMKSSEPYHWSLKQVRNNPTVLNQLGEPIEPGWLVTGSISTGQGTGRAFLKYSVSGPTGKGNVVVDGKMKDGAWLYQRSGIEIGSNYVSFVGQ